MATILQTTFSNTFSCLEMVVFLFGYNFMFISKFAVVSKSALEKIMTLCLYEDAMLLLSVHEFPL